MNILITGAWNDALNNINQIESMGHKVYFQQFEHEKLICEYEWVEGVICNGLFLQHDIDKFKNLKYIQLTSAGNDRVPTDYIKLHNIALYNAKGVYSIPMAEYAIAGVMHIYKHMEKFMKNKKNHQWQKIRNVIELNQKKVCIVGMGRAGIECAKRFKAFNCQVTGIARTQRTVEYFDEVYLIKELSQVIRNQDIVVLALALTEDTRNLIDRNILTNMKDKAVLVNLSRGEIVDEDILIEELKKQRISAVLDTFKEEPLSIDNELWDMENVIVTPHNSFVGENNKERLFQVILENLSSWSK